MSKTVGRLIVVTLIAMGLGLPAMPVGADSGSPFASHAWLLQASHHPERAPPQAWTATVGFNFMCLLNPTLRPDPEQLDMVEHYSVESSASDEYLQVGDVPDFEVIWPPELCTVNSVGFSHWWGEFFEFSVAFAEDTPAYHRSTATVTLEGEWGAFSEVSMQFLALPYGGLAIEAPDGIALPENGSATVPLTVTNEANTPLTVDFNPTLRGLNGPQPDVLPLEIEVGATHTINVAIETTDGAPAAGVLDIRWQASPVRDPDHALDDGRTRIQLVLPADPTPASLDVNEAPLAVTPLALLMLAGIGLLRRRA